MAPLAASGLGASGLQRRLAAAWAGAGRGGEGGCLLIGSQGCAPPVRLRLCARRGGAARKMTTTLAVPTNEEPDADVQTEGSNLTPRVIEQKWPRNYPCPSLLLLLVWCCERRRPLRAACDDHQHVGHQNLGRLFEPQRRHFYQFFHAVCWYVLF